MKKYGIGSRILTGLLVLAMVVSIIPPTIFAAVGDRIPGETGILSDANGKNVTTNDTISMPIRIYDYRADGMLFEYTEGGTGWYVTGGYGGAPEPDYPDYNRNFINGDAFTSSYSKWTGVNYVKNRATVSKANFQDFMDVGYTRFENTGTSRPHWWLADFANEDNTYVSKNDVRYVVMVYRTNNAFDDGQNIRFAWAVSADSYSTDYSYYGGAIDIASVDYRYTSAGQDVKKSTEWTYLVYDMKSNSTSTFYGRTDGGVADNWDKITDVAGVGCVLPMNADGESMDVAYVGFFGDAEKAKGFGIAAARFANDPGQDLSKEGYNGGAPAPGVGYGLDFTKSEAYDSYTVSNLYNDWAVSTTKRTEDNLRYARWTGMDSASPDYGTIKNFVSDDGAAVAKEQVRYMAIAYKTPTTLLTSVKFYLNGGSGSASAAQTFKNSSGWTYAVYDLSVAPQYSDATTISSVGWWFPGMTTSQSLDVSHIAFFATKAEATAFGKAAVAFDKDPGIYSSTGFGWISSNNKGFGMLRGSNLVSGYANNYKTYYVGEDYFKRQLGLDNSDDNPDSGIYHLNMYDAVKGSLDGLKVTTIDGTVTDASFDMSKITLDSTEGHEYNLLTTITDHQTLFTVGLTESTLNADKTLQYRQETVDYIAELLRNTLIIPKVNTVGSTRLGWYNYNYVAGEPSEIYGGVDLATALRAELNKVTPTAAAKEKAFGYSYPYADAYELGTYAKTLKKKANLVGKWDDVKGYIDTCYDAAYFLLNSIYVEESYNTPQDTYDYLILSKAQVTDGRDAFVFDAGFTVTTHEDENPVSAVQFDAAHKVISLKAPEGANLDTVYKTLYYYIPGYTTTYFPFLPVHKTNADGLLALKDGTFSSTATSGTILQDQTFSPYHEDDSVPNGSNNDSGKYTDANFNYVMVSNGEFVYHYEEDLFFEFEGDDDVYLYINGQLVLDIGGAHSISKVTLDLNDYVNEARANVAAAREAGKEPTKRDLALALEDGQTYDFDFYYMERHGVGANFRLATNIVVTDPDMKTNKQAYQGTDINGDPEEILFGGIVDINDRIGYSFSLTNEGNTKLYKLGFKDASIGVNMTYDGGLQLYGKPSVATFKTTAADTTLTIAGLNGIVNLDGKTYLTTASSATEITVENTGTHSLTLYQYEPDAENPVNSLFADANVTVTVGDATSIKNPTVTDGVYALKSGSNSVIVQGIRVCDRYGGPLNVSDLVITVDGYASAEDYEAGTPMGTLKIELNGVKDENGNYTVTPNQQLQAFLTNLKDPEGQTDGEEDETEDDSLANPYGHDGLWQHATVKITGFYYSMTEAEKEGNHFTNTVFATAYKFKDSEVPIRSQDRHRVYGLGTFEYYQWAGHTLYLDMETLWNDVVGAYTRTDDALIEQTDQITQLIAAVENEGLTALNLEVTDKYGIPWDKEYNLYSNETWGAYELTAEDEVRLAEIMAQQKVENTSFEPDMAHIYYFKRDVPEFGETESWNQNWTDVYTYYWSDTDTTLTSWPGQKMYQLNDDTWCYFLPPEAEYIIFSNGYSGWGNQTGDLLLPETALTAVQWDDDKDVIEVTFNTSGRHMFYVKLSTELAAYYHHVVIPVVVYVSETKDSYIVLDYGLKTENVNSESLLIYDDFLANYGLADAEFIGYYTPDDNIRYIPTNGVWTKNKRNQQNVNRVAVDGERETGQTIVTNDGDFTLGSLENAFLSYGQGADGKYRYSMPDGYQLSFTPDKIMDEEYTLYMAFRVYNKVYDVKSGDEWVEKTFVPNDLGPRNTDGTVKYKIDIHNEVQMFKTITVLPATVVYYEDDFADIKYTNNFGTFTKLGEGSGDLLQNTQAHTPYGQDSTYQSAANDEMSGNSLHTITLDSLDDQGVVASFNFKGTGFELISRTNSYDSASLVVDVYSAAIAGDGVVTKGELVKKIPVITEFTNASGKVCAHASHTQDGICTVCGISVAHNYVEGAGSSMYAFTVNGDPTNMIFNNGAGSQTGDLTVGETNKWIDFSTNSGTSIGRYMVSDLTDGSRTFYVKLTTDAWKSVSLYVWGNDASSGGWPGATMTQAYRCPVSTDAQKVIFNNTTGWQTGDLTIAADDVWRNAVAGDTVVGQYLIESAASDGKRDVYFVSNGTWNVVSIYTWTDNGPTYTGGWPGTVISKACSECGAPGKTTDRYYLVGYINGSDDYGSSREFINGTYTTTFTDGTYVHVQSSSGKQYWTSGYPGDEAISAILYENAAYADKFRIPTGIEVTITLLENPDGSLTLSYAPAAEVEKITENKVIYYDNSQSNWNQVKIHYWGEQSSDWPGREMNRLGNTNIYYFEVPAGVTGLLFNNGEGTQTADLSCPEDKNYYSGGNWSYYGNSGKYEIYQVPVIRVDGLGYGNYIVEISGMPNIDFSNMQIGPDGTVTGVEVIPTKVYIDGIRIFQPLGSSHSYYYGLENNAVFTELRDLILSGNAAVSVFDRNSTTYTGNKSWTENRNGEINVPDQNGAFTAVEFFGNMVSGTDEYMLVGPNNEAYMNGLNTNQAVIFYVAEQTTNQRSLQIAARALDTGLFLNGVATGTSTTLYQGVSSGNSYAWRAIGALQSGTEQYYTIDYAACPTVVIDGTTYYQVALHVRGGMASLSTVKTVGLTIAACDLGDATSLKYTANGLLEEYVGEVAERRMVWNLYRISAQMSTLAELDADGGDNGGNGESGGITGDDSNANTGDMSLVCTTGVMIMALLCLVFVIDRKKVF